MNIGLVLSGGMAKGAYQIGALQAISEQIPQEEISVISASSVGVLNAYAYATGRLQQAEKMWEEACGDQYRRTIAQMLRSSLLQNNIQHIISDESIRADCFYCTLLDIRNRQLVYQNLKAVRAQDIPLYLKASVAMPVYNRAVEIGGTAYFDGAMVDNIPVAPMMKHAMDLMLCIYFDDISYQFENVDFDNRIIKITFPSQSAVSHSVVLQKERIREMIFIGYEWTSRLLRELLAGDQPSTEQLYQRIETQRDKKERVLRVTGDMLVTNLNKVMQRLMSRKVIL